LTTSGIGVCKECGFLHTPNKNKKRCDFNVGLAIVLFVLLPGIVFAGLILFWYFYKEEDEYTEEYETFVEFYKYRCCCHCGQQYEEGPAAVEMLNPYIDPLDQAQWKIQGDDLSLGKRIGAGGCGWVYKGTLGGSGASVPVACKEVISATIDPEDLKEFQHEARMMTQLHHPYVITFYGVCEKIVANEHTGDPEQRMYMVTELAPGGSLEGHIEDAILAKKLIASGQAKRDTKLPFDGTQMVKWALQIAAGKATFFVGVLLWICGLT
jgi:hypothetical protein